MPETENPKNNIICFVDTPLLDVHDDQGQQRNYVGRWMEKVVDMVEVKAQINISVPVMLTSVFYYLITLVSVMFAGHLGELQLAGATLANSWATVTGFALMVGLSGALETLCGQGFGAREYRMLGIHLQASCFISVLFSGVISILWLYTETILVLLHQDHEISKLAALYMKFLIPGIFAYGLLQCIMRFLQAQSVVMPLVLLSVAPLILHFGITYSLVNWTSLGFKGAPLATSISLWISVLVSVLFVICAKKFKQTWEGLSTECFSFILCNLKLALPSAAMVCLEYWAFEMLVFLAGLMPDSDISTSLIAICVNTETIAYMIICGLSAAASTRVSNEIGAGHPDRAKNAMAMSIKLSLLFAFCVVLLLVLGNRVWSHFFSDNLIIIHKFASMTPLLAISILLDSIQGVLSGVARGCGWQHLAVCVNLSTFYLVGVPAACLLGFKLRLFVKGLWMGLICGLSLQATSLLLITKRVAWTQLNLSL